MGVVFVEGKGAVFGVSVGRIFIFIHRTGSKNKQQNNKNNKNLTTKP